MQKFVIGRETTNGSEVLVKLVAQFDSLQEAMDALYRGARRYGYEVAVDNSIDPNCGFLSMADICACWALGVSRNARG